MLVVISAIPATSVKWDDEHPSAWESRHGAPFSGMLIPFGAAVRFAPPTPLKKKLPKFGPNAVPGAL